MHALIAEQAGQMLGIVNYLFHRSTTALAPICYLQDLFTVEPPAAQGRSPAP